MNIQMAEATPKAERGLSSFVCQLCHGAKKDKLIRIVIYSDQSSIETSHQDESAWLDQESSVSSVSRRRCHSNLDHLDASSSTMTTLSICLATLQRGQTGIHISLLPMALHGGS